MALHTVGGVGLAMGSILPRVDSIAPAVPAGTLRCDICRVYDGQSTGGRGRYRVLRFGLEFHAPGQKGRGRHAGSIRICNRCWKTLGKPALSRKAA